MWSYLRKWCVNFPVHIGIVYRRRSVLTFDAVEIRMRQKALNEEGYGLTTKKCERATRPRDKIEVDRSRRRGGFPGVPGTWLIDSQITHLPPARENNKRDQVLCFRPNFHQRAPTRSKKDLGTKDDVRLSKWNREMHPCLDASFLLFFFYSIRVSSIVPA